MPVSEKGIYLPSANTVRNGCYEYQTSLPRCNKTCRLIGIADNLIDATVASDG